MSGLRIVREESESFFGMLGTHPSMLALYEAIRRAAALDAPVVVCGETGSGKELVAGALHKLGPNRRGPFCPVNVAALPEGLVESELFGHVKGAFTGACGDRDGLIHAAAGGTLFLDEAGDLPKPVQAKLLRVLEDGQVRRVGALQPRRVRYRLVVAIQEEPAELLRQGRWREDLYYRLTGVVLRAPPLRVRRSDIAALTAAFLAQTGSPGIDPEAVAALEAHHWPGNVRELQRTLVRAVFHAAGRAISADDLRAALAEGSAGTGPTLLSLAEARVHHVRATVGACGGDTRRAAELLGISRTHVYRLLKASHP